jgi:hypothetical protein
MSFLKSKHSGWTWDLKRTPFTGGGSGGGGNTTSTGTTTVQNTNIPEYARPYVEAMLGTAQQQIYTRGPATPGTPDIQRQIGTDESGQPIYETIKGTPASEGEITGFRPYIPYGATVDAQGNITNTAQEQASAAVAPFSPLQQQSIRNAGSVGMPGQFNVGTGFQAMGGAGALTAGQNYNMMATNPFAQQAFMSPYMQNAVDVQKNEAFRDAQIRNLGANLGSARQGTYGGARQVLAEQERNRNLQTQMGQIQATGTQRAFEAAQQAQQYGANLGLQGFGQAVGAGTALGQMGGQQLAAQQGIIGLQSQAGAQQQQLEQQKINQAIQNYAMQQQYPQQQLSFMSGLTRGLPLQSATTQSYQAAPSAISQIGGLGLAGAAAYGMLKKEGGIIKSYAEGGSVDPDGVDFAEAEGFADGGITRDVMLNPEKYSTQMIDRSTKNGVINNIVGLAALQQKNQEIKERQGQAAMAQGTPPTVKDQVLAEAQQLQGIDNAPSNLPTEYAGGGIVAFQEGGSTMGGFGIDSDTYEDRVRPKIDEYVIDPLTGEKLFSGYSSKKASAPTKAPAKPDTGIKILPDEPKAKSPMMTAPAAAPAKDTGMGEGGIDDLIRQSIGDIRSSGQASKDARKEAKLMAMLQAGLGIMSGTSPYAAANVKGALPALQGYQEEMRGIRSDENKQIAQIAALNLKGAELKNELNKLGITKERYDAQNKLDEARAKYFLGGGGRGANLGGAVPPNVSRQVMQEYKGYAANPTQAPFFSSLPKDVQTGLSKYKPGTQSYNRSMEVFRQYANREMMNELNFYGSLNVRGRSGLSAASLED